MLCCTFRGVRRQDGARVAALRMGFCCSPAAACLAARPALRIARLTAYTPAVEEALESAVEAAVDAAVEAATRVATSPSGAGFWQLTFAFVCGGLFFATATATAGAVYAFGLDNVKRGLRLFGLLWRRVWAIFTAALMAARSELLGDGKTRWKEVWALLGQGFGEAKRAAAEGVEAIKAEAGLYAFALGKTLH